MIYRSTILVVAFWGLIGAPSLCMAGAITHACGSHNERYSHGDKGSDGTPHYSDEGSSSSCSHEEHCASDPCQQFVASKPDAARHGHCPLPVADGTAAAPSPACNSLSQVTFRCLVANHTRLPRLPRHRSDLPLLI